MVQLDSDRNILYMVVSDKLSNQDFDRIESLVSTKVHKHGKIKLYYEMNHFKGWSFRAFWRDLYLDLKHRNHVEKIALVGDRKWEKWMADSIRPFSGAEVRFYSIPSSEDAKNWIRN